MQAYVLWSRLDAPQMAKQTKMLTPRLWRGLSVGLQRWNIARMIAREAALKLLSLDT